MASTIAHQLIANRYATALLALSSEGKAIDAVESDLKTINVLIQENKEFSSVLMHPLIRREEQVNAMLAIGKKAKCHDITTHFLAVLATNKRLMLLPSIISAFLHKLSDARGEVKVDVESAETLSAAQQKKLHQALNNAVGKEVLMSLKTSSHLIGGLTLRIGSQMIDSSILTQLNKLKTSMKGT